MLFNSIQYLIFFPIVAGLYFLIPHKYRWLLLLAASYYFYMSWKAEFILLILTSTATAYFSGLAMAKTSNKGSKRLYLWLGIGVNLGLLFFFKYFNFLGEIISDLSRVVGSREMSISLKVLLPVGISFYTFQTLSYIIDVYRGNKTPERHFGIFALYVAFFPQLVAGPIERSTRLLPQFFQKKDFDYARVTDGMKLIFWGLFKKVVIADRLAIFVNEIYNSPNDYGGAHLLIATYFFAFQILCDFSGYSDIAIGSAKVLGYDLMENFRRPYFAKSTSDFWNRWHISLSTWFRDYLFLPITYGITKRLSDKGIEPPKPETWGYIYGIVITMFLCGLWHGAGWTFILWGTVQGLFMAASVIFRKSRKKLRRALGLKKSPRLLRFLQGFFIFNLISITWVLFRANSIGDIGLIYGKMISDFSSGSLIPQLETFSNAEFIVSVGLILFLVAVQIVQTRVRIRDWISEQPWQIRWGMYFAGGVAMIVLGKFGSNEFIYFQF